MGNSSRHSVQAANAGKNGGEGTMLATVGNTTQDEHGAYTKVELKWLAKKRIKSGTELTWSYKWG